MKELADGHKVSSRSYYFLLDWNDKNNFKFLMKVIGKNKLKDCNKQEYIKLFKMATKDELSKMGIKRNK
ncbi:hypothetical protein KAR91_73255 [Candidatus Pacearchaeota archaeon]|nr:hypothetical protein [Candidatus Pacearchaeota archaeon]